MSEPDPPSTEKAIATRVVGRCMVCRGELREEAYLASTGGVGFERRTRVVCDCPARRQRFATGADPP